ncbi:hypothetical protein EW026_g4807 [Hermanssonia centrifuga]|uniref:TRUD domain-containing protein n=1 Tax=Hermanssonia centrifuga TaxID=98765 RepID=A0A4S4KGQ4_9APHY|nr:hypothetical protein EW026_g4807 [Hermanssonia centrifuga]
MSTIRQREEDADPSRSPKRTKLDAEDNVEQDVTMTDPESSTNPATDLSEVPPKEPDSLLPPSHVFLNAPPAVYTPDGSMQKIMETDVGISEYVGHDVPKIEGIIKQRFTDFLVFEVDLDSNVIHLKSLEKPESSPQKKPVVVETKIATEVDSSNSIDFSSTPDVEKTEKTQPSEGVTSVSKDSKTEEGTGKTTDVKPNEEISTESEPWPERFTTALKPFLSEDLIDRVKNLYLEGPEPPFPISSKETRTGLHQVFRELFAGKLDTETDTTAPPSDDGSRIVIKWSKNKGGARGGGRGGRSERGAKGERGTYPPYIHFTLQKTNRDTQDALAHISRSLHCYINDLSVAGTKDKRGVTVQRVSLRRGNKTVEDVWRLANGLNGRRTAEEAVTKRGERGIRIADFNYRKASLELGMLKGNAFVITLRTGMQRFGTASIPTHTIGLALLKSEWQKAVSFILRVRPGEHPDVVDARNAWLIDGDLDKALELMPRRVVAERCLLESFKKQGGDTRNAMGALSTIPRNLRLMYVHAYQSYVWNAIVSERIRMYGAEKPAVGDLVFVTDAPEEIVQPEEDTQMAVEGVDDEVIVEGKTVAEEKQSIDDTEDAPTGKQGRRSRKPYEAPRVKALTEADLDKYSIFDVIMPLPGRDVSFPGSKLGERYREFLKADGLDPDNFVRKQKEYSLGGSYRKIMHLPKELSWSVLRYTDPDAALAQADEDKLLNFDPPLIDENGKFMALQVRLTLGTAAYATMALREVTKTETSSHYQTALTQASEDQKYRTSGGTEEKVAET